MKTKQLEIITKEFESRFAFMFDGYKMLPFYGQEHPAFLVNLRFCDKQNKIFNILQSQKLQVISNGSAHNVMLEDDLKFTIIYCSDKADFDWLYNFYSYSNSIVLGKIFKAAGLKYSEDGLQYIQYDLRSNHKSVVGTYTITRDFSRLLELLGLNVDLFNAIKSQEEFFALIVQSPYFYSPKFINYEKEQRAKTLQNLEEYLILKNIDTSEAKKITLEVVKDFFSEIDFDKVISDLEAKAVKKMDLINKFDGKVILEFIPDFDKKRINASMKYFKFSFGSNEDYIDFLMNHSKEEVIAKFKETIGYQTV